MKKIVNPYDPEKNMCFGCSEKNPMGLKLKFTEYDDHIHASWTPSETYQGYPDVLHGGIIAALLDEIGAWCVSVKAGTAGVTTVMTTRYMAPVRTNKGSLTLKAFLTGKDEKNAKVTCHLYDDASKLCAEAVIEYFLYPLEIAKRRYRYPGRENFYERAT